MRVLVDTNVLISAILFPDSIPAKAILQIAKGEDLYLTSQNIQEFNRFINDKKTSLASAGQAFLEGLNFTLLPLIHETRTFIRDETDQPILNSAMAADIDYILTGDKDFLDLRLKKPRCLTPKNFLIINYFYEYRTIIDQLVKNALSHNSA